MNVNQLKYVLEVAGSSSMREASPALSALVGLWNLIAAVAVLIVSCVVFIWLGTKIMRGVE